MGIAEISLQLVCHWIPIELFFATHNNSLAVLLLLRLVHRACRKTTKRRAIKPNSSMVVKTSKATATVANNNIIVVFCSIVKRQNGSNRSTKVVSWGAEEERGIPQPMPRLLSRSFVKLISHLLQRQRRWTRRRTRRTEDAALCIFSYWLCMTF